MGRGVAGDGAELAWLWWLDSHLHSVPVRRYLSRSAPPVPPSRRVGREQTPVPKSSRRPAQTPVSRYVVARSWAYHRPTVSPPSAAATHTAACPACTLSSSPSSSAADAAAMLPPPASLRRRWPTLTWRCRSQSKWSSTRRTTRRRRNSTSTSCRCWSSSSKRWRRGCTSRRPKHTTSNTCSAARWCSTLSFWIGDRRWAIIRRIRRYERRYKRACLNRRRKTVADRRYIKYYVSQVCRRQAIMQFFLFSVAVPSFVQSDYLIGSRLIP